MCSALGGWGRYQLSPRVAGYFPSAGELVSFAVPMLGLPKRYSLLKSHYSTKDLQGEELQGEQTVGEGGRWLFCLKGSHSRDGSSSVRAERPVAHSGRKQVILSSSWKRFPSHCKSSMLIHLVVQG